MPILKQMIMPNHSAAEFHYIRRCEISFLDNVCLATILSYPNEQAFLAGVGPVWSTIQSIPLSILDNAISVIDTIERWLIVNADNGDNKFVNGTLGADNSQTFQTMQDRTWDKVKVTRAHYEYGGFLCAPFGKFDSDEESMRRIAASTTSAMLAKTAGTDWSVEWTLSNNDIVNLTADDMIAVGVCAVKHVNAIHDFARQLRIKIDLAMNPVDLEAVLNEVWPAVIIN